MPKVLLMADIHSNLPALEALDKDAGPVDFIIHAGDTVGYGPFPNECVEWMRDKADVNVLGNHDNALVTGSTAGFGRNAAQVLNWTDKRLTAINLRYLSNLPKVWTGDVFGVKIGVVHGGLTDPFNEFIHPYADERLVKGYFDELKVSMLVTGHVHQLFVRRFNDSLLVNPGGAGQPRDGKPDPSYVLLEIQEGKLIKVEPRRFRYDIDLFKKKQLEEQLPMLFADRLYKGN